MRRNRCPARTVRAVRKANELAFSALMATFAFLLIAPFMIMIVLGR